MQSALTLDCDRPHERAASLCLGVTLSQAGAGCGKGTGRVRARPCCKGELRAFPLCVRTALLFLTSNGDLPTLAALVFN